MRTTVHLAAGRRLVPTRPSAGDSFTLASDRDTRFIKRIHSSVKFVQRSGGGILKGGELCAPLPYKRFHRRRLKVGSKGPARPLSACSGSSPGRPLEASLERPSSADFLGAQEVGPPAGAGPGNLRRRRRHIWNAPEGREKGRPSAGRKTQNRRAAERARDFCRRRRLRLGFRPAGPGRMATPYGESKGVAKRQPEWGHHLSRRDKWRLWPSLNARRRSAALAAGEERI